MIRGRERVLVSIGLLCFGWLSGCTPEGNQLIPVEEPGEDPCKTAETDISDGIQDGSELRAVFDCVNKGGQFDSFVPLMDAMEYEVISDGQTTILNMWLDIARQGTTKATEEATTVTRSDLSAALDDAIALLDEAWLPQAIDLLGQFLASGAIEPGIPVVGGIAAELVDLRDPTTDPDEFSQYFSTLADVLCPDLETKQQCVGDFEQLSRGMAEVAALYGTEDYPGSSGEQTAQLLAGLFAPAGGDVNTNEDLNEALGKGIARLGANDFLPHTFTTFLPALYGDDPSTPELEGYESLNANESALYGITELLSDLEFATSMGEMTASAGPLVQNYYEWRPASVTGYGVPARSGTCSPGESETFAEANPAYYGFDQILRLLKAADVDYLEQSDCGRYVDQAAEIAQGLGFELSDSTNLATFMLEIFAQLPAESVAFAVDLGSLSSAAIDEFNTFCGTDILPDDYEALQASVHLDKVIVPTLKILAAINHAGAMDATKSLIVELYDTRMLCESQPFLAAILTENGPLTGETTEVSPFMPGQPFHASVTIPMLRAMMSLQGDPADTLAPPITAGLESSGKNIGLMLTAIGQVANDAVEEALFGGDPALYHLDEIMHDLSGYAPENANKLESLARSLEDDTFIAGVMETLANESVQEAFDTAYPEGGETAVGAVANFVNDGTLLDMLYFLRDVLGDIDAQADESL